jgi:predicted phosphodiesterase
MRLALLSDIHGNVTVLEAVLKDISAKGSVDGYWILGDLVAIGPRPIEVLEHLHTLPSVTITRGNTDRYVTTGARPQPQLETLTNDLEFLKRMARFNEGFAWTQGMVAASGWFNFLKELPLETRLTLPNGTRLLGVHASPNTDEGEGVHPNLTDEALQIALANCDADLICVGHTHWPLSKHIDGKHVINLGSVSLPMEPSLLATYMILESTEASYTAKHYQVSYDRTAVIQQVEAVKHPARGYITELLEGKHVRPWNPPELLR